MIKIGNKSVANVDVVLKALEDYRLNISEIKKSARAIVSPAMNIWDKYSEINLIKNKCSDIFIIVKGMLEMEI